MTQPVRTVWLDVSNTLDVNYITGFQRLTRELLARLTPLSGDVRYRPVRWCVECGTFRTLNAAETQRLSTFVASTSLPRSRASQMAEPLPQPLKSLARRVIRLAPIRSARDELARRRRLRDHPAWHAAHRIDDWPDDSWFFDIEAAWHNVPHRAELLPWLAERGLRTTTLIADVIPFQFPQWFDANQIELFSTFIEAHLRHSERFLCISKSSERDVIALAERLGIRRTLNTSVVTMGANFHRADQNIARPSSAPEGRYLLTVGTIEPRKNHGLLIDAFDLLRDRHRDLSIVIVGKAGWLTTEIQERLRTHPDSGGRVRWLDTVDDRELDALYRYAFLAVQPAFYEGFGAPVVEALANGVPTLSSNGGALPEAGGTWAEYFDPNSVDELVALIDKHLAAPALHEAKRLALADYQPPSWEDGAADIEAVFAIGATGDHPGPANT